MQNDPEGGGWFDVNWEYDEIQTGPSIGEVSITENNMRFKRNFERNFEHSTVWVSVANGTYDTQLNTIQCSLQ
jgi:hypothetical protein